ncbi:MAG TPA: hypothetical protein VN887_18080 [Candidatus Angelobacter sp.]|nr:hypothetical protein [Candidatus Angelobacter sp.]
MTGHCQYRVPLTDVLKRPEIAPVVELDAFLRAILGRTYCREL